MQSADQNGVRLFFEETQGEGAPVVLIHGWCCDHTYLAPQFEHFAKKGRRVVALDLRGHGRATSQSSAIRCQPSPTMSPSSAIISTSGRLS
jgi:pimeloyl-ACP methyl ester carboxylesterase